MTGAKHVNHTFRPVIVDPAKRWRVTDFDLKFDANWTHQPGCEVSMDKNEVITVVVHDHEQAINSGLRFATSDEWVKVAAGQRINVTLTTRSLTETPVAFQTVYLPQDRPHSGFIKGTATVDSSILSFDFDVPAETAAKAHFIMVEPLQDDTPLEIVDGRLKIL